MIALRQAGVEPVVASMGTALTESQLRDLSRLTKRVYLCFDSDAAGQEATLRGMELAVKQGFDVRVVALPKGQDPADAPDSFAPRLGTAESYVVYRVRIELDRAEDRQEGFVRAREVLAPSRTRRSGRRRCACLLIGSISRARRWPGWLRRPRAAATVAAALLRRRVFSKPASNASATCSLRSCATRASSPSSRR